MTAVRMETMGCEDPLECEEWYAIFKAFDADNDGLIPTSELKNIVRESTYQLGLNRHETEILLSDVDKNQDQIIDFAEFSSLMLRAKKMQMHRLMLYAARSVVPKNQQTETARYLLQYNCFPPPVFLFTISMLQLLSYLYYVVKLNSGFSIERPVPTKSIFILDPYRKHEIWRYFTYMFVHVGYMHLLTNLMVQIFLGIPLELVHKFWRIGLIYALGVMCGALLFFVVDREKPVYLAGASGGVYTLLSAHVANVVINWSEMEFNWLRSGLLLTFIGADAGTVVYQVFFSEKTTQVSHVSHIGGFIAGILLGVVVLRNLRKRPWEAYAWWVAFSLFIFYVISCIVLIMFPFVF